MPRRLQLVENDLATADPELRGHRALATMDALEFIFESVPGDMPIPARHVLALVSLANASVRVGLLSED